MDGRAVTAVRISTFALWAALVLVPLALAIARLDHASSAGVLSTLSRFESRYQTEGALWFTFRIALLSAALTAALGVPIAWSLARHRWPAHRFLRGLFTAPFVTPSILAALGFLALMDVIDSLSGLSVAANPGARVWVLLLAHAWFNIALVVRLCEPLLTSLDPALEEAARLLPAGRTATGRMRHLWLPLLAPAITAASTLAFVFCFTSFALVRWLTPGERNLEVVMANQAEWGGIAIPALGQMPSEVILAASMVQLVTICCALGISSWLQRGLARRSTRSVMDARRRVRLASPAGAHLAVMVAFVLAPIVALIAASLTVRAGAGVTWSLDGWRAAWGGSRSDVAMWEALIGSIGYAVTTLAVALPVGCVIADSIRRLEVENPRMALALDLLAMLPLALSAVMIGLGVLIGIVRSDPSLARVWWMPALGHVMLTTPFVVRVVLPAMREIDPDLEAAAALLGASPLRCLVRIRLPMLRGSLIVAASLVLAISLGEFGASWVVVRFTDTTTLPVMIDGLLARPGFDPLLRPAASAAGVVLLALTMALFMAVERFRPEVRGGVF